MRKIKQGKKGPSTKYISRAKAIRKLQLSLKDFRRLCILKGVYPREPPKRLKKHSRTYYHLKDVNFLNLDPIIEKMRALKVYKKKYIKAKAKGEVGKIQYLAKHKPQINLNHLIKERYPDFLDAIRDLDDPLSLMALFSIFPSHKQFNLTNNKIDVCSKLLKHFELYLIKSNSLKKIFVSLKGIYYQSQILGQKVTYITPYKYPPNLPIDVDYRVMCTFLDFYIVLMKFVNYKLYTMAGLKYPPVEFDATNYQGYEIQEILNKNLEDDKFKIDEEFKIKEEGEKGKNLLFNNLHFYLSTEVPRYSLEFVILSFGGTVSFENNRNITHIITDRDTIKMEKTKQYVQPQWIYDSINCEKLLNVKQYQVNKQLPPHLSPFIDENDTDRYVPEREKQLKGIGEYAANFEKKIMPSHQDDDYDIIKQKKKEKLMKKEQEKQLLQISKSIMTGKDRRLLNMHERNKGIRQDATQKLKEKSQKLKKKQ